MRPRAQLDPARALSGCHSPVGRCCVEELERVDHTGILAYVASRRVDALMTDMSSAGEEWAHLLSGYPTRADHHRKRILGITSAERHVYLERIDRNQVPTNGISLHDRFRGTMVESPIRVISTKNNL